jgi:hypothetical protein
MGELAALGVLGVLQQRGGGGVGLGQVLRAPGLQAGGAQVLQQLALAQRAVELPVGPRAMGQVKAPPWRSTCSCCSKRSVTPAL